MILVYLLGWCILGYISLFVIVCTHMVKSYMKGYDSMKWWEKHTADFKKNTNHKMVRFICGLILWPMRLIEFVNCIPKLYEQYELR